MCSRSAGSSADPVVVDTEDRAPADLLEREANPPAGVSCGILGEVPDEPFELLGVSDDPSCGDGANVDLQLGGRAEPGSVLQEEIIEVDRSRGVGDRSLVDPREQEEVLDQPLETRILLEHHLRQFADGRPLRMGEGDFRELADRGHRRAELVGSVRDEPTRPDLAGLQPLEHPVHRAREPGDLVIARRIGNPPMEVAG